MAEAWICPVRTLHNSRKGIIKVAKNLGVEGALPGTVDIGEFLDFEERWMGAYIFENEWQRFRTPSPGLSGRARFAAALPAVLPLPLGEGRGEGD
jgi:hypothetical protein